MTRNCSGWNCITPSESVNRTKNHSAKTLFIGEFIKNSEESQKLCSEADVIVVERNFFGDTLTMMQYWKVRNKTVIAIFDDAYDLIHPQNISHDFWKKGEVKIQTEDGQEKVVTMLPKPIEQFKWGLRIAKAVQVPSVNLAKDWSKYNKTYYVHNYLNINKYLDVQPLYPKMKDELVIGWCGSMSHHSSFTDSGILTALRKVARVYSNVKVVIGGDRRLYDLLDVKNKVFQPYVPDEQWTPLIKSLDIGLAPLAGEYDKRRSWIKVLEYMALKVPWVATNYETYSELTEFGITTDNGYQNWEKALSTMIENYSDYQKISDTTGYEFALDQSSEKNIEKVIIPLYEELLNTPYE